MHNIDARNPDAVTLATARQMKSCPFCGGAARLDNDDCGPSDDNVSWWPECENKQCVIYGYNLGGQDYATADAAIAAWNARAYASTR